jgi:hypothetical protein
MNNFILSINPKDNPNEIGELLRGEFFNQKDNKLGCYETFEIKENVKQLEDEEIRDNDEEYLEFGGSDYVITYKVFSKEINGEEVIMKYFWDGDGVLEFHFKDGTFLSNDDCKKTHDWEYYE